MRRFLASAAVFVSFMAVSGSAAAGGVGPPYSVDSKLLADALHCPATFDRRERPAVLLVHGTSVTDEENWSWNYQPALTAEGFDVCTVLLPDRALGDIQISSEYVVFGLREIAARARRRVSVIGISQGALEPRWAIKWWPDTRDLIEDYVSMAGTNHGANYGDAACTPSCAPALWQQRESSNLLRALNAEDETPGDLDSTSVYSLTDPIIQPSFPVATAAIEGASNVAVQDICPGRPVDHIQSVWDAVYWAVVLDALVHDGPADPSRVPLSVCAEAAMPGVSEAEGAAKIVEVYLLAAEVQAAYPKTTSEPPLAAYADRGGSVRGVPTTPPVSHNPAQVAGGDAPTLPVTGGRGTGPVAAVLVTLALCLRLRTPVRLPRGRGARSAA